jgi:uncharacterized membrane protein
VMLALAVRHQKAVASWQAAGLIVGFAGAVLIFTPWHTAGGLFSAGGLECLAASISYAVSYIYMDRFLARRGIGSVVLSACQLAAAAVMLAIALAVTGAATPHVTAESVAAIVVLGIVGTGFAYVLNYQIITSEGATAASTVTYLLPVVAIVLGVLVLGESITVTTLAGIALVLAGGGPDASPGETSYRFAESIFGTHPCARSLCHPGGPDGKGQARGQAQKRAANLAIGWCCYREDWGKRGPELRPSMPLPPRVGKLVVHVLGSTVGLVGQPTCLDADDSKETVDPESHQDRYDDVGPPHVDHHFSCTSCAFPYVMCLPRDQRLNTLGLDGVSSIVIVGRSRPLRARWHGLRRSVAGTHGQGE